MEELKEENQDLGEKFAQSHVVIAGMEGKYSEVLEKLLRTKIEKQVLYEQLGQQDVVISDLQKMTVLPLCIRELQVAEVQILQTSGPTARASRAPRIMPPPFSESAGVSHQVDRSVLSDNLNQTVTKATPMALYSARIPNGASKPWQSTPQNEASTEQANSARTSRLRVPVLPLKRPEHQLYTTPRGPMISTRRESKDLQRNSMSDRASPAKQFTAKEVELDDRRRSPVRRPTPI